MARRGLGGTVLALAVFAALGCGGGPPGPKTVAVSGAVTKGGKPWSVTAELGGAVLPPGDVGGAVIFTSKAGADGEEFAATLDPTSGTFQVLGLEGNGIPPGPYDVVVYLGAHGGSAAKRGGRPESVHGREVGRKAVTVAETGVNTVAIDLPAR